MRVAIAAMVSSIVDMNYFFATGAFFKLNPRFSKDLKIMNCWKIVKLFETNQYNVKPAGNVQNINVNTKALP